MSNLEEKIIAVEKEIRETPYHKGTEHHIGRLKARLARLLARSQAGKKKYGFGFALKKEGDATVVLVGPPSVGKSTLLNCLTAAHARVEPWPFTTLTVIPGIMKYRGAQIQIFDLPGVIAGAAQGVGRGREVLNVAKTADLILLVVDVGNLGQIDGLLKETKEAGISLSPLIVINKIDIAKKRDLPLEAVLVSAEKNLGIDELKEQIWIRLGLVRIFLKSRWGKVNKDKPLIMRSGQSVLDVAHRIFPGNDSFSQPFLWGPHSLFSGQPVSLSRQLKDEDILSFI